MQDFQRAQQELQQAAQALQETISRKHMRGMMVSAPAPRNLRCRSHGRSCAASNARPAPDAIPRGS